MNSANQTLVIAALVSAMSLSACTSANPVQAEDVRQYTSIELCPAAEVRDLTSKEERDTTPGFSFHVTLGMPQVCISSFERQLTELSPAECTPDHLHKSGCFVSDAFSRAGKHTSIMVHQLRDGSFDLRFYS